MTDTETVHALADLRPGDTVHVLRSGLTIYAKDPEARPLGAHIPLVEGRRGVVFTLTDEVVAGNAWLLDEEEQVRRWGEPVIGVGPWPSGEVTYTRGTPEEEAARDREFHAAAAITDPAERAAVLRDIRRRFPQATSVQLRETIGDDGRDRHGLTPEQRRARDRGEDF